MYFESLSAALAMDGHGAYVWSAYLIAFLSIIGLVLQPRRKQRAIMRQIAGEHRRREAQAATERGDS